MSTSPTIMIRGIAVFKAYLSPAQQVTLLEEARAVQRQAPLFSPTTAGGKPMSVRMTSAGKYGWVSDTGGYRYDQRHPGGMAWPAIPPLALGIWKDLAAAAPAPECCLINYYGKDARMGMHQDRDEADFRWPVVSISLGDDATFRVGREERGGPTESLVLSSGDVLVMGEKARLVYHGIDRIRFGTSKLLKNGGRLNLTLRVVT